MCSDQRKVGVQVRYRPPRWATRKGGRKPSSEAYKKNRAGFFIPRPANYISAFCEVTVPKVLTSLKFPAQNFHSHERDAKKSNRGAAIWHCCR
jgi:hypothetical protein